MAQKTIICLRGKENTGKTTSIRECFKVMTGVDPSEPHDFIANLDAGNGIKIGFSSWGDPGANRRVLERVLPDNCDVVITACRSYGDTVDAVEEISEITNFFKHFSYPELR